MTTKPPPPVNPYAPTDALAHGESASPADAPSRRWRPVRTLALIVALLTPPLAGAGLFVLGRRRAVVWMIAGLCSYAAMIASVFAKLPGVFVIALGLAIGLWLAGVVFTTFARTGASPVGSKPRVVVALLLILATRAGGSAVKKWLVEGYQMPSASMLPTLLVGDHIMVAKTKRIAAGDMVVFRYPPDPSVTYVKRAVAVGGQTVEVSDGVVWVDGVALQQLALVGDCPPSGDQPAAGAATCRLLSENAGKGWYSIMRDASESAAGRRMVVPPGQLFVLGDNRDNSSDSRVWGPVPLDLVEGRPAFVWWSRAPGGQTHWDRVGTKL